VKHHGKTFSNFLFEKKFSTLFNIGTTFSWVIHYIVQVTKVGQVGPRDYASPLQPSHRLEQRLVFGRIKSHACYQEIFKMLEQTVRR
jgi:hypothetical protein